MALRTIRIDDDEILRKISKPVKEMTPRIRTLLEDMGETLLNSGGVGLAAVQVGVLKRIALVNIPETDGDGNETRKEDLVIINPEIEVRGDSVQRGTEGCLSIPEKWGIVDRPMNIVLRAYDENLEAYELEASGFQARAIMHECDHMDGILYKDKALDGLHDAGEEYRGDLLDGDGEEDSVLDGSGQ